MRKAIFFLAFLLANQIWAQNRTGGMRSNTSSFFEESTNKVTLTPNDTLQASVMKATDEMLLGTTIVLSGIQTVIRIYDTDGDSLILYPKGFLATNSKSAGVLAFQLKDGATQLFNVDTTGLVNLFSGSNTWALGANGTDQATFSGASGGYYFDGDIYVMGDDLFATTNTLGALWVGDGTNYNPVVMSGDGTIAANGALTVANDSHDHTTTISGKAANVSDADFGDLTVSSGVWAVEDDSHAHTGASLSGIDISDDTNLSAGSGIVLTGDALSHSTANGYVHTPADGASTQLLQYSSAGTAKWITMSGDGSIADGGAFSLGTSSVREAAMNWGKQTADSVWNALPASKRDSTWNNLATLATSGGSQVGLSIKNTKSTGNIFNAINDADGAVGDSSVTINSVGGIAVSNIIGATQSDLNGLNLKNPTAAAAGAQQYSPSLVWSGKGWKTDATAASQTVKFMSQVVPVQGTANPTGYLGFYPSINDAAYSATPALSISSNGFVRIGNTNNDYNFEVSGNGRFSGFCIFGTTVAIDGTFYKGSNANGRVIVGNTAYSSGLASGTNATGGIILQIEERSGADHEIRFGRTATAGQYSRMDSIGVYYSPSNYVKIGKSDTLISVNAPRAGSQVGLSVQNKKSSGTLALFGNDAAGSTTASDSVFYLDSQANIGNNGTVTLKRKVSLDDTGEWTAPTGVAGFGKVMASDNTEYATFRFTSAGVVSLDDNSANVGTTNDVDAKMNIYDGGDGIVVENQLGSTLNFLIILEYMIP